MVKNRPAYAGDIRDVGSISGLGRSPGGGHGYPLQYSCLENPMNRGVWWATVHGVAESDTTEAIWHARTSASYSPLELAVKSEGGSLSQAPQENAVCLDKALSRGGCQLFRDGIRLL